MGKDSFSFPMGRKKTPFQVGSSHGGDLYCKCRYCLWGSSLWMSKRC